MHAHCPHTSTERRLTTHRTPRLTTITIVTSHRDLVHRQHVDLDETGLPGRLRLGCRHASVHAGVRGSHVSVVSELQSPAGEDAADQPASAAVSGTDVRALLLNELNGHGQAPHAWSGKVGGNAPHR